ncbi:hypothetical protein J2752_002448 [Halarchaeum rubridurum]|uniref:Cox cluster protein n=1 Tax=Halarchaeum rubridurum TaxID=489911 RepID=A0A830G369_9EURY|nr:hypothetical protein [Halarchaeum rubridurum]MBP1955525.1 hypothetical protein [Halarchaeum rubridurum]GGM73011.1 hypothetical protein GCM10009017_23760 [Halarchaeum rubridurum]
MEEQPGLSEQYTRASPWPVFVALGLVLTEFGVFLGNYLLPVGVGGVLLLETSVVGILRESGYVDSLWPASLGVGLLVGGVGVALLTVGRFNRGVALAGAGGIAVLAAVGFFCYERGYL